MSCFTYKEATMNKNYVYPAVFHPNDDGSYTITFPDLPGCISEGKSLENALNMAQKVLKQHLDVLYEYKEKIPAPSDHKELKVDASDFVNLIRAELKDERAVKKTISIQKWQDEMIAEDGLSLSRFVQDKLTERYV